MKLAFFAMLVSFLFSACQETIRADATYSKIEYSQLTRNIGETFYSSLWASAMEIHGYILTKDCQVEVKGEPYHFNAGAFLVPVLIGTNHGAKF